MDRTFEGLSEEQQNDCRAALRTFVDRHQLFEWGMVVKVNEAARGQFSVKIEITPLPGSGLRTWPLKEIAVADESFDIAAEVDRMLELTYQDRFPEEQSGK